MRRQSLILWGLSRGLSLFGLGIAHELESREYAEERAAACRRNAAESKYPDLRESMLKNAAAWDEIARKAWW